MSSIGAGALRSSRRRLARMGGQLGVVLALTALVSGAVGADAFAATPAPSRYVALGDSYSSGQGYGRYDTASGTCNRSDAAFPVVWSKTIKPAAFVACSGAKTSDVQSSQLSALDQQTTLVTLTAGGNDLAWTAALKTCALGSDTSCANSARSISTFISSTLPGRLDALYRQIRDRAPSARVFVMGYPRLFETGWWCGLTGVLYSSGDRRVMNGIADSLDSVIQKRAAAAGLTFVDVRGQFAGHGICGSNPYISDVLSFSTDSWFHPNNAGQQAYASALRSAVAR
jgi:lysophospholipase L1-like esterase